MPDVFISYKRTDRSRVELIASLLRESGFDVWFDARLNVGSGEGFDAEINREVASAHCVVACWTEDAVKSIYVRAEALKGLEANRLAPIFLSKCNLPIPFNAVDVVDLSTWTGNSESKDWQRFLVVVKSMVELSKADEDQRRRTSQAEYEKIRSLIYPGTLAKLSTRIAALHDFDIHHYHTDILELLAWLNNVAEKETGYLTLGYERAERQSGGDVWRWWDRGGATERAEAIRTLLEHLRKIDQALQASLTLLQRPAP